MPTVLSTKQPNKDNRPFKRAVIHYPKDEKAQSQINKDVAAFRCKAVVKYIESLNLNDAQIETLFSSLEDSITEKQEMNRAVKAE